MKPRLNNCQNLKKMWVSKKIWKTFFYLAWGAKEFFRLTQHLPWDLIAKFYNKKVKFHYLKPLVFVPLCAEIYAMSTILHRNNHQVINLSTIDNSYAYKKFYFSLMSHFYAYSIIRIFLRADEGENWLEYQGVITFNNFFILKYFFSPGIFQSLLRSPRDSINVSKEHESKHKRGQN